MGSFTEVLVRKTKSGHHFGKLTIFLAIPVNLGLGLCGITNSDEIVVAVSTAFFNSLP